MRRVILHRRATRYLRRMPRDRQAQMVAALEEVEVVFVDYIGPRGDAY